MDPGHHHHQHQLHHHYSAGALNIDAGCGDRFPPWGIQETRDFLVIRAELDPNFMETKRNRLLWEVISTRMKEKGYTRSAEQCKCKWKNLVTRYKGCETMDPEGTGQQFLFYNELQTMFTARMQRMLWLEAEGGGAATSSGSKKKAVASTSQFSSDEEDENEESEGEKVVAAKKRRKLKGSVNVNTPSVGNNSVLSGIKEMMDEFMRQQMQMETQWMQAYETREEERRVKESEWRQTMGALENERLMLDRRWREREEQRKIREEARAEKRDALITALLNKLRREDNM